MTILAFIELRDLELTTQIGTYGPHDTKPDVHLLDLTLGIDPDKLTKLLYELFEQEQAAPVRYKY